MPEFLLGRIAEVRRDSHGQFDELVIGEGHGCRVHFEMMDDNTLWVGLYPDGEDCIHVTISARGKLSVAAHEA